MNFIKRILSSLISAARGGARRRYRLAVCVLSVAAAAASLTYFQPRRAQAQQTPATLHGAAALDQLKQDGQYDSLQAAMRQARFSVSHAENTPLGRSAWHAPNPAAGYDAYVTEAGVSIAVNGETYVSLHLRSLGYGAALHGVAAGEVYADKQSITINRNGGVREWFVNGAEGLEHGFTLDEPPSGARQQGLPLRLALQVSEGWQAIASEDGQRVTLRNANDQAVEYGKLVVRDTRGLNIPARLTVADEQVVIEVEDFDAVYPLTIDPLFTLQQTLFAPDGAANDYLGISVALDGDTALVGSPGASATFIGRGSAAVFTRSGTTWKEQKILTTSDAAANDGFGNAVALSGETAVIGASLYGGDDRGKVFTFKRGAAQWVETDRTEAPNPVAGARFGTSLALSGDRLAVGATLALFAQGADQRSAYVFVRRGIWQPVQQFGPELGSASDRFGYAVALDGDTVLIGAPRGDATATDQGVAYAFVLHDSRHPEQQMLTAADGAKEDAFGTAVALDGDTLAVGAPHDDIGAKADQGSVYVFTRSGKVWTLQQRLLAGDGAANGEFGAAVALSGDRLAVGAPFDDVGNFADRGSVTLFKRTGTAWAQETQLDCACASGSNFGAAVSLDINTVVAGAPNISNGRGAAFAFTYVANTAWVRVTLSPTDNSPDDKFGTAVALSGDTAALGAYNHAGTNDKQGSVYVFRGSGQTWTQQQILTAYDDTSNDRFGGAVALSDNFLVIGASFQDRGANSSQGAAYVFTDIGGAWHPQQKLTASDGAANDHFGNAVAVYADTIAVGAVDNNIGTNADQGSAYVFASPAGCPAITLTPDSLPNGALNKVYSQFLTTSGGGAGGYRFTVSHGALPPGLTLGPNDGSVLSGTPTATGTYRFTITSTYYLSLCTGSREYTLTIQTCPTITVSPATLPNGAVGAAYNQVVTATGGTGQNTLTVTAGALPPGLSLSANVLSGTPTQTGSYNFTVTANSNGCTGTRAYALTINVPVVTCVSAASYLPGMAPESIVAAFGVQMATQTQAAASFPLPTELAGVSVRLRDRLGVERQAPLFFVAPGQINLQIPAGTATGTATVSVSSGATGQIEITNTAPGLFAANADGQGVPAALFLRVRANGPSLYEAVARLEGNRFMPAPLDLGPAGEQVFLVLFGTGIRFRQTVSASVGGLDTNVLFAGAAAGFAGLDQINLSLPRALAGRGEVDVVLRVDGVAANTVRISVR